MKGTLLLIIANLIFLTIATGTDKPLVVSSASMFSDMTREIAGELVDIETIVPIGGDPHLHDPTPRDARIVAAADLIFVNGLSFEGWITELIENAGTQARIVTITENIQPIQSEQYKGSSDPHAWMDAANGRIYIKNIKNALNQLLPENSELIEERYRVYDEKMADLDHYIQEKIDQIPKSVRILITSHDAFAYYGKRYNIRLEPIVGISTEAEAQTSDIVRVTEVIRKYQIPAVFIESTINPKLLQQIAKDHDIVVGGQLYADSLGDQDSPASTYLKMLRHNTDTIYAGLTGQSDLKSGSSGSGVTIAVYIGIGLILIGGFIFMITRL